MSFDNSTDFGSFEPCFVAQLLRYRRCGRPLQLPWNTCVLTARGRVSSAAAAIAVGGSRSALHLLDSHMNVVRRCEGHTGTIYDVQATADFVLSAGDESVRVFDWETGIQVFRIQRGGAKAVRA